MYCLYSRDSIYGGALYRYGGVGGGVEVDCCSSEVVSFGGGGVY
jgi:hypothetical protein